MTWPERLEILHFMVGFQHRSRPCEYKTDNLLGYYFKSIGSYNVLVLMCFAGLYAFFFTFSQFWLKWWTESPLSQTWAYMAGYLIIAFIAWLATSLQAWYEDIVLYLNLHLLIGLG